jgi:hypothetical protein
VTSGLSPDAPGIGIHKGPVIHISRSEEILSNDMQELDVAKAEYEAARKELNQLLDLGVGGKALADSYRLAAHNARLEAMAYRVLAQYEKNTGHPEKAKADLEKANELWATAVADSSAAIAASP